MEELLNKLACLLVLAGALNWGAIAVANVNLVDKATSMVTSDNATANRVVYALVGLAAVLVVVRKLRGKCL
jgi:uncharacterized membrane protein YuzA (DUF378 family)